MIRITCPNNNIPERTYSIDVLFKELLGLKREQYDILFDNHIDCYLIKYNDKTIVIEDHFFIRYPEPLSYLSSENLPKELKFFHGLGLEIPILYGVDKFICDGNKTIVGIDVFASTFFMLTRWEESLLGREENGDCDENELFCVKNEIFTRPIVHEYEKLLRLLLSESFLSVKRNFKTILTHDVDAINTPSWNQIIECICSRKHINTLTYNRTLSWKDVLKYKNKFPNAYSQTKKYVDLAKKYIISEWFYIKVCSKGERGYTYDYRHQQTREYVKRLSEETGCNIVLGFHPSQLTFNNTEQWKEEIKRISFLLNHHPSIGRNHHLLYNNETLHNWLTINEQSLDNVISISNCVFHKHIGFRSGISIPYYVFDIVKREQLDLQEYPCVIMDTALIQSDYIHGYDAWDDITKVIDEVKNNNGVLILTWHILIRKVSLFNEYFQLCEDTIKYATKNS